jgi:glycerophosphoryl diester phosphodiesterase
MVPLTPILERVFAPRRQRLARPLLKIGHRGACGEAPENTFPAFDLAWKQGATGVELDVHLSSDGVPVVIHDARLDRTTSGHGWVSEHRARVLRRLDAGSWFNRRFPSCAREQYAGARIPTLAEVLRWARRRDCHLLIEIKEPSPGTETAVLNEIDGSRAWDLARIISFDLSVLARLRQINQHARLGVDSTRRLFAIRRAQSLGAEVVLPHWAVATRRFIHHAHQASLLVIPWTLNHPLHMRQKILDGVDGIITNYPARLTAVMARLEGKDEG